MVVLSCLEQLRGEGGGEGGGGGGNCSAISDRNSVSTFQLVYFIIV